METLYTGLATVGLYGIWFVLALFIKRSNRRGKK